MYLTPPWGHVRYREKNVHEAKSARPRCRELRAEEHDPFPRAPFFVDLIGLPDLASYAAACRALISVGDADVPVVAPDPSILPGHGRRPELSRARAFTGERAPAAPMLFAAPGSRALVYASAGNPAEDPFTDPALADALAAARAGTIARLLAPSPRVIATTGAGVTAYEAALGAAGAEILYSTDPDHTAIRAQLVDAPTRPLIRALAEHGWDVVLRPASEAPDLAVRSEISVTRDPAARRLHCFIPAGVPGLAFVRRLGHELLAVEDVLGLETTAAAPVRAALAAFVGVLWDDLIRFRFGLRFRCLRSGLAAAVFATDTDPVDPADPVVQLETAAAVAELLSTAVGSSPAGRLAVARHRSPRGAAIGEHVCQILQDVADPTVPADWRAALDRVRAWLPVPTVLSGPAAADTPWADLIAGAIVAGGGTATLPAIYAHLTPNPRWQAARTPSAIVRGILQQNPRFQRAGTGWTVAAGA